MVVLHEPAHEMRPRVVLDNPPQEQLRRLTLQMPNAKRTAYGSVDVFTSVDSRSSGSTYIVTDTPEEYRGHQTMPRAEYEEITRLQEEYIAGRPMIVIDGYISNAKEVQTAARLVIERANPIVVIGLSGTGKTTTTFRRQGDSKAVQDDFIALMPGGKVYGTENGCFAKTFSLSQEYEPEIYRAVTSAIAYLENVYLNEDGTPDFFNESFTQNGRAVFPLEALGRYEDATKIGPVNAIVILNRARSVVPALAKLTERQAAAYFMLGETQGTSAGGKDEAGKSLRVPGTNPFFPLPNELQGNRFLELLRTHPIDVYLMNTGWIVDDSGPDSKKVTVEHSSACIRAIADGGLDWSTAPDFGYQLPVRVP